MEAERVRHDLRLPADLYARIAELAKEQERSVNAQIIVLLRKATKERKR
jgi:hypothetical protein